MATVVEQPPQIPPFPVHRFTVAEYHRLGEVGVLTEADRVELLQGWIVPKMIHNPRHDGTVSLVHVALLKRLSADWYVRIQSSITTEDSEPEPDLAIVPMPIETYVTRHPQGSEIALVIEVADTSLARDRAKCEVYARAGIPSYWIINLTEQRVEVYSNPQIFGEEAAYQLERTFPAGEKVPLEIGADHLADVEAGELLV